MIYEMSQSLRKSGLCRRDMKKDFGMLINGLLEVYGEQCEERMDDSTEEMLLKVLNHLVGQKVRSCT